jgi:hypothetical protein
MRGRGGGHRLTDEPVTAAEHRRTRLRSLLDLPRLPEVIEDLVLGQVARSAHERPIRPSPAEDHDVRRF